MYQANGASMGSGESRLDNMVHESKVWNPVQAEWRLGKNCGILFQVNGALQKNVEWCFRRMMPSEKLRNDVSR